MTKATTSSLGYYSLVSTLATLAGNSNETAWNFGSRGGGNFFGSEARTNPLTTSQIF